jgi:hypothetical protein
MDYHNERVPLRPFYFVLVVWGREYRDYFLEYCLPSLLAPGNIPAVAKCRPSKYLIATTSDDWESMRNTAIFRELERYVDPVFIELPPCPPDRPYWMQNIVGHKLCCDIAFRDRAYRIFTGPDAIFADGAMGRLNELASAGTEVVFKLTVPSVKKEPFFEALTEFDMRPAVSARDTGKPLSYSGRQVASAAIRSMHSMSAVNEWQASYFCGYASTPWWRVPGEDGMIACGLFWDVLLIDYAAVKSHDSAILDDRGWDGDYIMRTVGSLKAIYLVRDSDDINAVSWSSNPTHLLRQYPFGSLGKGVAFRASYFGASFNSLHRTLLFFPTRIHGGPLNDKWTAIEDLALQTLLTWIDPPINLERLFGNLPSKLNNYVGIDARIASCRLPWWRRNGLTWAACRFCLFPLIAFLFRLKAARPKAATKNVVAILAAVARRARPRIVLPLKRDNSDIL